MSDDLTTLRRRQSDLTDALDDSPDPSAGNPSELAVTARLGTYPTAAGAYYAVQLVRPGGVEAEGEAPTFTPYGGNFYALNLGTAVPPLGTHVVITMVSGRWVFRFDG